jgi:AAA15 family ATPase/GTPase
LLSGITLENFKAFEAQSVELRPITVIVGPNNSGKSSLLAPVRLLVQTIQSFDYSVPLLLDGPLGDFGTFRDVVYGNEVRRRIGIRVAINEPERRFRRPLPSDQRPPAN